MIEEKKSKFDDRFWELIKNIGIITVHENVLTVSQGLDVTNEYFIELCNNYKFYLQKELF